MSRSKHLISIPALLLCGAFIPSAQAAAPKADSKASTHSVATIPTQIPGCDALLLGTAWYPEQWSESRWEEDLRLMEAAGIRMVRVAEFAWSRLEPREGAYDFDWLERAISLAAKHHIVTVLGTPTATPPAWLTQAHPETLRMEESGRRATHGGRAHGNVTSPLYRQYCAKIARAMGQRFGHNPNVVGWQIDNEYCYALMSFDDAAKADFQAFLKSKYQTLDALNDAWTTAYWSQTYFAWDQIPIPIGGHNPGLQLEWKHFITKAWKEYQDLQIAEIRQLADARQFYTGNFMGFFDGFDHYDICQQLSFASWDDYVGSGHLDGTYNGLSHDLTRGFKNSNFWIMETQPGHVNWAANNNDLNKGEIRAMAWQAIAHGSDAVGYWQWRSALGGQEQYHGTLVGTDGTPVPFYDEVAQLGREFIATQALFKGTAPVSEAALLFDYDSRWAIQFQKHADKFDAVGQLRSYYQPLRKLAQSVDVVNPKVRLDAYRIVFAPALNVMPKETADHLLDYVRGGGHLVLGPRSGMKGAFNELLTQRQPGFLADALGGRVEQYYALEKDAPVSGPLGRGQAMIWAEQLKANAVDTEVLLRYGASNGWLDDQPAVITRKVGKGRITLIGAVLDESLTASIVTRLAEDSGVKSILGAMPEGVEVSRRVGDGRTVYVLINLTRETKKITLPRVMKQVLGGKPSEALELPAYGVEILTEK
jgi:beta-galactosidase